MIVGGLGDGWGFGGHVGRCGYSSYFHETLEGVSDVILGRSVVVLPYNKVKRFLLFGFSLFFGGHVLSSRLVWLMVILHYAAYQVGGRFITILVSHSAGQGLRNIRRLASPAGSEGNGRGRAE